MTAADGPARTQPTIAEYVRSGRRRPLFLAGDAVEVLRPCPADAIDFCMPSPPYWGQRAYAGGGIGREATPGDYVRHLLAVFAEVKRVLKPAGSFWLNLGDAYAKKCLL